MQEGILSPGLSPGVATKIAEGIWCESGGDWVCSASRREGSEETLLLTTAILLEDTEEMEPDSFQRCTVTGQKVMDISGNIGNSS